MRLYLILFFIGLFISTSAQTITNTKHATVYSIKQETSTIVVKDNSGQTVAYFFKNSLLDKDKNAIAFIKENGDVYKGALFVGVIKKDKIMDSHGQLLGHVYPDFGHATNDHGQVIMYIDSEISSNLAALLIFFIKDLK